MDNDSELLLAFLVAKLAEIPQKKFDKLVGSINSIYEEKTTQEISIKVDIRLGDIDSKNYQALNILYGLNPSLEISTTKMIQTIFYDGLLLNTKFFLRALEIAMELKNNDHSKED